MDAAARFLAELFGAVGAEAFLALWTLPGGCARFFRCDALAAAAEYAVEAAPRRDVYVGAGLHAGDHGARVRGAAADVVALVAAWADLDCTKAGATKPYFPTRAALDDFLGGLPIPPTIRVGTGGGVHAWWAFKEPWHFQDADDRLRAAGVVAGWQRFLQQRAAALGVAIDSTFDLARVLRLPGTVNHKHGVPVTLVTVDGPRIDPGALAEWGVSEPASPRAPCWHVGEEADGARLVLRPDAAPPPEKLEALLANHEKFRRSWEHRRPDLTDQSASTFDQSLATIALQADWTAQDVANLLIAHRRRHGAQLKLRPDYYARTLARARAALERARAEETRFEMAILTALQGTP